MTKADKIEWAGCPVRYAAGIFGDKWCLVLLRDILLHGKRSYGAFAGSEEGIASNILADRLRRLEAAGMISRHPDPHKKSKRVYLPTEKAIDLLPALLALMVWSVDHDARTEAPASFAPAFREDPVGTVAWYRAEIARADARALGRSDPVA